MMASHAAPSGLRPFAVAFPVKRITTSARPPRNATEGVPYRCCVRPALALLLTLSMGCIDSAPSSNAPQVAVKKPPPAQQLLERVVEAYHKADRYEDSGQLRVRYKCDGEIVDELIDFSVAVSGPNKLRMHAYQALVVCDGRNFRATINEAPGEVFSVPAPEELSLALVYGDRVLGQALNRIVGSIPLALFLDPEPLGQFAVNAQMTKFMSPRTIDGEACQRVRIERTDGAFVLWIDERTLVVRRVEYPTDGYRELLESYYGSITGMTITAELTGARLDSPIDDVAFQFEVPKGAELVHQFEAVRMGTRIPKFELHALDGRVITRDSLAGKIVVIMFWQKDDAAYSLKDLSKLEQVYARYRDQDSIVFLAVSADLDETSDDDLRSVFTKAKLSLPMARVTRQVATRAFGLQLVPTTMILGNDGRLQELVKGPYLDQLAVLPKELDQLLAGGDLIATPQEPEPRGLAGQSPPRTTEVQLYLGFAWSPQSKFADATQAADTAFSKAEISPRREPEKLRLKRLWACTALKSPGNLLVVANDSGRDRMFALEGLRSVAELDAEGNLSAMHRLDLPARKKDAVISFLRTAGDGAGKRFFLGSAPGVQQLHVFDDRWKRLRSFPEEGDHAGISDALLADLDGDGEVEIAVGYYGEVGIHCVSLDGRRLWRNRAAENVLGLAVWGPDGEGHRGLLATSQLGTLLPIDAKGNARRAIVVGDRFARLIFTADLDGDEQPEWCAIAHDKLGSGKLGPDVAVGISPGGEELWSHPLPAGKQPHPAFEAVAAGNLLGHETGQWVIAGADGSIHILAIDGALIDRFNYGASLSGLAVAHVDGRGILLVATDEAVEAWQVEE
ncbi:MAG TPA: redoxin domain-containing protein [Pirellulales bacterium]|nr:redoxin domain-containing protein [Pirellulales bacterium]